MRSGLGVSTRSKWRRSGCPGNASTSTVSPGSVYGTNTAPPGTSATPSPRLPKCEIVRRSVTLRPEQEFLVPLPTLDRRRDDAGDLPPQRCSKYGDLLAHRLMHRRIAHDAFL